MEPFLKWTGGKRSLLKHIEPLLPSRYNRYFEPFVGGGALFFDVCPPKAVLGDHNADLIECYEAVRDSAEGVIEALQALENSQEEYYRIRGCQPCTRDARAARTIYLTALSFNGIYRVNLSGRFNVPYGQKTHIQPCDAARIRAASHALRGVKLVAGDFSKSLARACTGDLVYLDPPYTVAHNKNNFVKYNANIFAWEDQIRLAKLAKKLSDRGCWVLVSNADHTSVDTLYAGFEKRIITRSSVIAASSDRRTLVTESLYFKEPKP